MIRIARGLLALSLLLAAPAGVTRAEDDEGPAGGGWDYGSEGLGYEAPDGRFRLRLNNRVHVRFTLKDRDPGSTRGSFDISRFKLRLSGEALEDWAFRLQVNFADGSENSQRLLEDAWFEYMRFDMAHFRVGQGKTFFGRQQLTSTGKLQFVDTSIATERFAHGRDVGLTVLGENDEKTYSYSVGVYNGNGINKDEKDNADYMATARLVLTPLGEFVLDESDRTRPPSSVVAVGMSLMTVSTGTESFEETRVSTGGVEVAYKVRGYNLVGEFFTESDNAVLAAPGQELDTDGWYLQMGYLFPSGIEVAGRYSEVLPEEPEMDLIEAGLGFTYHFSRPDNKIQIDFRRLDFESDGVDPRIDRDEIRAQLQLSF